VAKNRASASIQAGCSSINWKRRIGNCPIALGGTLKSWCAVRFDKPVLSNTEGFSMDEINRLPFLPGLSGVCSGMPWVIA
jgi:hypothetical protein